MNDSTEDQTDSNSNLSESSMTKKDSTALGRGSNVLPWIGHVKLWVWPSKDMSWSIISMFVRNDLFDEIKPMFDALDVYRQP